MRRTFFATHVVRFAVVALAVTILGALNAFPTHTIGCGCTGAFITVAGVGNGGSTTIITQTTWPLSVVPFAYVDAFRVGFACSVVWAWVILAALRDTVLCAALAQTPFSGTALAILCADAAGFNNGTATTSIGIANSSSVRAAVH